MFTLRCTRHLAGRDRVARRCSADERLGGYKISIQSLRAPGVSLPSIGSGLLLRLVYEHQEALTARAVGGCGGPTWWFHVESPFGPAVYKEPDVWLLNRPTGNPSRNFKHDAMPAMGLVALPADMDCRLLSCWSATKRVRIKHDRRDKARPKQNRRGPKGSINENETKWGSKIISSTLINDRSISLKR